MYRTNKINNYWHQLKGELKPTGFIDPGHCNSDFFVPTKSGSPVIH